MCVSPWDMLCTFSTLVCLWPLTYMLVAGVFLVSFTHSFYLDNNMNNQFMCCVLLNMCDLELKLWNKGKIFGKLVSHVIFFFFYKKRMCYRSNRVQCGKIIFTIYAYKFIQLDFGRLKRNVKPKVCAFWLCLYFAYI